MLIVPELLPCDQLDGGVLVLPLVLLLRLLHRGDAGLLCPGYLRHEVSLLICCWGGYRMSDTENLQIMRIKFSEVRCKRAQVMMN